MAVRFYTEQEMNEQQVYVRVLHDIYRDILNEQQEINYQERRKDVEQNNRDMVDYFPFIKNDEILRLIDKFRAIRKQLPEQKDYKFLDVGCGVGNIMKIAKNFFCTVNGIEIDKRNIDRAKMLFGDYYVKKIFNINAFDFKDYNKYDVIYYYCPIKEHKIQRKLEKLIERKMKVGAYLIPISKQDNKIYKDKNFLSIELKRECYTKFYQKISDNNGKKAMKIFIQPKIKNKEYLDDNEVD